MAERKKVSEAVFTGYQESATAFILERVILDNKQFKSPQDILNDTVTIKGLNKIFKGSLHYTKKIEKKTTEWGWLDTFYLQQKAIVKEFGDPNWTIYNRDGGFMDWITKLISSKCKISKKDAWNPADIWLIRKNKIKEHEQTIKNKLEGKVPEKNLQELNVIMRDLFIKRDVVGISLKKISKKVAYYEEINVQEKFFKNLKNKSGDYSYSIASIKCYLSLKDEDTFSTQDTVVSLKGSKGKVLFTIQIKGNTTSRLANLKYEPTDKEFTAARLGKAPLDLIRKLAPNENVKPQQSKDHPVNSIELNKKISSYVDMFKFVKSKKVDVGNISDKEFKSNITAVMNGDSSHIGNSKLQQLFWLYHILKLKEKDRNEFLTDIIFIAQKKGNKVFDFGPFGKLY
jgi:hypothetical protein